MSFPEQVVRWFLTPAHWQGTAGIWARLTEHVQMSAAATLTAAAIALPIGLVLGHFGRGGAFAINVSNAGRALPSFAILVLAVQVVGIGATPAYVALVALGIPPILTNTYVGVRGVDRDIREAARGMGMTSLGVLIRIEIPLAMPLIMAGLRTSAVQIVATATLAALVAWGGLGRFIIDGLAQQDYVQVFAGAILVAGLSLLVEVSLGVLQRVLTPAGIRGDRGLPEHMDLEPNLTAA